MKIRYVIRSMVSLDYWDTHARRFRDLTFAIEFNNISDAENVISNEVDEFCEIVKMYRS